MQSELKSCNYVTELFQNTLSWQEDSGSYECRVCKKTFYNAIALQNHKKLHHEADGSNSETEQNNIVSRHDNARNYYIYPRSVRHMDYGPQKKKTDKGRQVEITTDDEKKVAIPRREITNKIFIEIISLECVRPEILEAFNDFKFIPLKKSVKAEGTMVVENGLTKRTFDVDISYVIVKVEGDDDSTITTKRSRLDGVLRRTQMRTSKPPVDLRGPFTCTLPSLYRPDLQCHQIFFNCCEYSLHYREKHTKRRKAALRCQVCEKRLDKDISTPTLQTQFNIPNNITFPCRLCGQVFLDRLRYDEHNRIIHAKMKPHQCSICAKRFTQQGGLQQHMRMHTGIRPFVCSFCNKAFTQKAGLDQHLRTHTKVKPFKCVICSKCFSQSVHLRQHMRTHTNIQPFECPVCGRRFKQSSHLNFHMRSHGGDTNGLIVEQYAQAVGEQNAIDFLKLANVQPVQDGETVYYAAELSSVSDSYQNPMVLDPQVMFFGDENNK